MEQNLENRRNTEQYNESQRSSTMILASNQSMAASQTPQLQDPPSSTSLASSRSESSLVPPCGRIFNQSMFRWFFLNFIITVIKLPHLPTTACYSFSVYYSQKLKNKTSKINDDCKRNYYECCLFSDLQWVWSNDNIYSRVRGLTLSLFKFSPLVFAWSSWNSSSEFPWISLGSASLLTAVVERGVTWRST